MDRDTPLWRALEAVGDTVVVGLLIIFASLPVVTAAAALSAGAAVLGAQDTLGRNSGGSVFGRYAAALRRTLGVGTRLTAFALSAAVVGGVDVFWALSRPLTVLSTFVLAAGVLLLLTAGGVASVACTLLTPPASRISALEAVKQAGIHAAAHPHRALAPPAVAATAVALIVTVPVALPLLPLLAGLLARSLRLARPRLATSRSAAGAGR